MTSKIESSISHEAVPYAPQPNIPAAKLTVKLETDVDKRTIQVRIFRGEKKYVAECLDLPVVTEGNTLGEVAANIQEAIGLHLEGESLAELGFSAHPTILATMELEAVA